WLSDLQKTWFLFQPATEKAYTGVGMEAAGLIGQRVSKMKFADFVAKNLFAPLGMNHSSMIPDDPTLPAALLAQKWQFSLGLTETSTGNQCLKTCDTNEQSCLNGPNTGPTQIHTCAQLKSQCLAHCPAANVPFYTFSLFNGTLLGDDQPMIWPA